MANLYLPRELTSQLRQDAINAFNELVRAGKIPHDSHYQFVKVRGVWGLEIWRGERAHPIAGVAWVDAAELVASAGVNLGILRGYHD